MLLQFKMYLKYASTYFNIAEDLYCSTAKAYKIDFVFSREANTVWVFLGFSFCCVLLFGFFEVYWFCKM